MTTITIELTETQHKGLEYVAADPQDWVENVVTERCRKANDEVVDIVVKHCLDNGVAIPGTREEIVTYGFANDIVKTAAVRNAEVESAIEEDI